MSTSLASIPAPPFQALDLGPLSFRMYGLCIALGVLGAVTIARRRFAARGGDPEDITTLSLVAVPAGLIGARIYHVITDWPDLYSDGRWWPDAFMIWKGGLGIPGGVMLGAAAALLMARRMKVDWRLMSDAAAPALPVAQAIGRLGNYFNQELFGRPTTLPWGLQIDPDNADAVVGAMAYHPTFLYELLWNLGVAALLIWADRRWRLGGGRVFALYVAAYATGRIWIEALRIDEANSLLGVRLNVVVMTVLLVGAVAYLVVRRGVGRESIVEPAAAPDRDTTRTETPA